MFFNVKWRTSMDPAVGGYEGIWLKDLINGLEHESYRYRCSLLHLQDGFSHLAPKRSRSGSRVQADNIVQHVPASDFHHFANQVDWVDSVCCIIHRFDRGAVFHPANRVTILANSDDPVAVRLDRYGV